MVADTRGTADICNCSCHRSGYASSSCDCHGTAGCCYVRVVDEDDSDQVATSFTIYLDDIPEPLEPPLPPPPPARVRRPRVHTPHVRRRTAPRFNGKRMFVG